jgi:two-component system, LytTR family, response regulator LytT
MKIVIIEDEELTAEDLAVQIGKYSDDIEIEAVLASVEESVRYFKSHPQPDLIFSDIQLQDGASFDIYRAVSLTCPIVFCTAFNEFALEAIKNNGIDYILKPFSKQDVHGALDKYNQLKQNLSRPEGNMDRFLGEISRMKKISSVLVYYKDKILPIRLEDVALFFKQNEITYLKMLDGKQYAMDQTMDHFEQTVGSDFFRVSRQVLIQHRCVKETVNLFNRKLEVVPSVQLDFRIEVSRNRVNDFLDWLTAH